MAEKLIVVACRDLPASIEAVQAVPLDGGWGDGVLWGTRRVWGVWRSRMTPATRQALETLRLANTIRVAVWDDGSPETHVEFKARARSTVTAA